MHTTAQKSIESTKRMLQYVREIKIILEDMKIDLQTKFLKQSDPHKINDPLIEKRIQTA